jgi:hypothetical protein
VPGTARTALVLLAGEVLEFALQMGDAISNSASIRFQLGFARASRSDAAAQADNSVPFPTASAADSELRELDLYFAFATVGPSRKNIENQLRASMTLMSVISEIARIGRE